LPVKESFEGFDKTLVDFLLSQKTSTRITYRCFLRQLLEFTGMTGQQLLESKKADKNFEWERKVIDFKQWMKQKGYSDNSASGAITALRSFFDYYRTPLLFNQNENRKLNGKAKRVTLDYMLTNEDIAKMVFVGNLREKYIVLLGKSFGLRAGDFVTFIYGTFRSINLDNEAPIFVGEFQTQKEGVNAFPFIDSDALPILKAVLDSNKDKPNTEKVIKFQEQELTSTLQNLAVKANINLGGKHLRFHCFRKWLIDRLSSMMSESKWKQIVGKAVSEDAYVSSFELRESFSKAMKMTTVLTNGNGKVSKKVEEMEGEFQLTKSQLAEVIAKQQKDKEELLQQISNMYEFVHKTYDPATDLLNEISDIPEAQPILKKARDKIQEKTEKKLGES